MITCYSRHSHFDHTPTDLPSPSPSHLNFFDNISHTTCTPPPSDVTLRNYFGNPNLHLSNLDDSTVDSSGAALNNPSLMTSGFDFRRPAITVQPSTPMPRLPNNFQRYNVDASGNNGWDMYGEAGQASNNALRTPRANRGASHQRALSASSDGSEFSSASNHNASGHAYATTSYQPEESSRFSSKQHLPTPSQTPTQDSFLSPTYQPFTQAGAESNMPTARFALNQALIDSHDEDIPQFAHSSRQSVSSYGHNSPATPHGDEFDERIRIPSDYPKFDENASQILNNQLMFAPATPQMQQQQHHFAKDNAKLSPYRSVMHNRLQAANDARSQSSGGSGSRAVSPFRQSSPYAPPQNTFGMSPREQQPPPSAAMRSFAPQGQEPKTISPKDALLDYNESEDSKMPLLPHDDSNTFSQQFNGGNQFSSPAYINAPTQSSIPNFNFNPAIPSGLPQIQFSHQHYRPRSNMQSALEPTPEFPAHLTSMESSASEAGGPDNNFDMRPSGPSPAPGPERGTYSCPYRECTKRFRSTQDLNKHKKEHQQTANQEEERNTRQKNFNATPGIGSGMTSAQLMQRNSQAGPHKCTLINPQTNAPCNAEFSRPYDLTRHEDTIHNERKPKVRCTLCMEEKTFSRNDALTRHMRVVHPEVDFPGKHRRRGNSRD